MDALLRGSWGFHRRLLHASGDLLEVRGRASWTPLVTAAAAAAATTATATTMTTTTTTTLIYDERGRLTRGGAFVAEVRQSHTWRLRGGAGAAAADVHFEEGRFFHAVARARPPPAPGGSSARASCAVTHDCAPDKYEGEWAVIVEGGSDGAATLECEWRVSGPAKSYRSTTRFWREEGGDAAAAAAGSGGAAGGRGAADGAADGETVEGRPP